MVAKTPLMRAYATHPPFLDNLPHWGEHFDKYFNLNSWFTLLSNCSPHWGRLSKKRGRVAYGCAHAYRRMRCFVKGLQNGCKNPAHQPYATHPLFLDNLHLEEFVKRVNHKSRVNYLTNSSKWRLSKKGGWVAYACRSCVPSEPRNPRLKDVHTGTKCRLDAWTNNRDSGIEGSCSIWIGWCDVS